MVCIQNTTKQILNIFINMTQYKSRIIKTGAKLIISDFNMLPNRIEESWINDFTDNFLIYDRAHRYTESEKIKHQNNVGYNIYDIFDFINNNYHNLPEIMIFCKGNVIPRHCGFIKFINIINNTTFTSIENYIRETPLYTDGCYAFVDENDSYNECFQEVDSTAYRFGTKYISNFRTLMDDIFINYRHEHYIKFAPGANYIIPKSNILKYNKNFYETMRQAVSYDKQPGEAYILERAIPTIFNSNLEIKEKYKI
jgi:hypothetical protein